ncbi:MAG TPA: TonB-dependent receptor [Pseudidiomarina sp.]|nr:TonB-dependent receptor [Pseudidiomarina sp.]
MNAGPLPNQHRSSVVLSLAIASGLGLATPMSFAQAAQESPDTSVVPDEVMVVTGSRTEQHFKDVAGDISVVDDITIERQVSTDLADAFRYDPAITSTGQAGGAQTLTVRGIGGNRLIYIKDGRRLNDAYEGGGGFLIGRGYLDVTQVKQIEVAKSAASSLYGSDGLGGIILITTPDPDDLLGSEDSYLQFGTAAKSVNDEWLISTTAAQDFQGWQGSVTLSHRQGKETQNYEKNLPGYDFDTTSLLTKALIPIDSERSLKLTLDHYQQETSQIISEGTNETLEDDRQTAFSIDWNNATARPWADSSSSQLYLTQYRQQSDQLVAGGDMSGAYIDTNDYRFDQDILGFRWQAEKATGDSTWVYGIDADYYDTERPRFKTRIAMDGSVLQDNQPQLTFPGANTLLAGVFAQNTLTFAGDVRLILGLRADYYRMQPKSDPLYDLDLMADIKETALSPKVGLVIPFSAATNVYAQYTRGFRIPPHDQAYQNHGIEPFYAIIPNADLEPEKSDAFELGLKHSNDDFSTTAAVFYSDFTDFIESQLVATEPTYIPGVQRSIFQYQNLDSAHIYGAEVAADYWLNSQWKVAVSALWMSGKNDETDAYLTSLSPLSGSMQLHYEGDIWYATAALRAAAAMSRVATVDDIQTAGWGTVDLLFGRELGAWQFNIAALNLTDKRYVPYNSVAGQAADINTDQYSQPGRSVSLRLSYTF